MYELTIKEVIDGSYVDPRRSNRLSWESQMFHTAGSRVYGSPVVLMNNDYESRASGNDPDYYIERQGNVWIARLAPSGSAEDEHYESLVELLTVFALRGYTYYY